MLRDHLKIQKNDSLQRIDEIRLHNQGQETITEWAICGPEGQLKGRVILSDKLYCRRSWPVNYRITQQDPDGKVILDKLIDVL